MNLPGRLGLTTLGDVLGVMYREGATGVLELTESQGATAGRVHRLHLVAGLVGEVESEIAASRLGDILRRQGLLGDEALRQLARRLAHRTLDRVGDVLVGMGAITRDDVAAALRLQRGERLERLFLVRDARIAFRVARARGAQLLSVPLEPREFLFGRPRGRDRGGAGGHTAGRRRDPVRSAALSTLGLAEGADRISVQRAFRQLASRMHPDRFPAAGATERANLMRRFAEITAAYHELVA
jgi:hypothetical protein